MRRNKNQNKLEFIRKYESVRYSIISRHDSNKKLIKTRTWSMFILLCLIFLFYSLNTNTKTKQTELIDIDYEESEIAPSTSAY